MDRGPHMDRPAFDAVVPGPQGWALPPGAPRIPLTLAVAARPVD